MAKRGDCSHALQGLYDYLTILEAVFEATSSVEFVYCISFYFGSIYTTNGGLARLLYNFR
jgi:hypothetical protein